MPFAFLEYQAEPWSGHPGHANLSLPIHAARPNYHCQCCLVHLLSALLGVVFTGFPRLAVAFPAAQSRFDHGERMTFHFIAWQSKGRERDRRRVPGEPSMRRRTTGWLEGESRRSGGASRR
jgi:hypothetical protein